MRALTAAGLAALAVAPIAGSARTAVWPVAIAWAPGPQIAVQAHEGGVYVIDPATRVRRLLVRKAHPLGTVAWAPDRRTVLFTGNFGIWTISSNGSGLHRLGKGFFPRWSPDGRRIAFFRAGGLFVMNANGTGAHMLARDRYAEEMSPPAWSPDSRTVAYVACTAPYLSQPCEHQYGFDAYTIPAAGGTRHRVSRKSGWPSCLEWSSRGRLSYTSWSGFIVVVRGDRLKQLPLRGCAVWSPDGRRFATGSGNYGPIVANENGGGRRELRVFKTKTNALAVTEWAPDGQSLAYLAEAGGRASRLLVVSLNGRHVKRLIP